MSLPAVLLLSGEEPFFGSAVGDSGLAVGPMAAVAYATGMGDLLTDPAYGGMIVCFTYPHVGTTGIVPGDSQSDAVAAAGVVGREIGRLAANRLGTESMVNYLRRNGVPAIEGLDTRSVAQAVARRGMVMAALGTGDFADMDVLRGELAKAAAGTAVPGAGVSEACDWEEEGGSSAGGRLVLVYDFGVKKGFLRRLVEKGCRPRLVPKRYPAERALAEKPCGVVFSSGPGAPADFPDAAAAAVGLMGKVPVWGIGVGAGVVAVAAGAKVMVDGRGHFGVHPVGRVGGPMAEMTNQAHGFWIDSESMAASGLGQTHVNLNDRSVEGFACERRGILGCLFNPEGEPGPRDSRYLFDRFAETMT